METDKEFEAFVKRQLAAEVEGSAFDPAAELRFWLGRLDELYKQIEVFLESYVSSGQIAVRYQQIQINEEFCGTYAARQMILRIGPQEVSLSPIGTMLIGSRGRVDVLGPAGRATLSLLNKKAKNARSLISVTVHAVGQSSPRKQRPDGRVEWEWKLVSAPPEVRFTSLTREMFLKMILEVTNA